VRHGDRPFAPLERARVALGVDESVFLRHVIAKEVTCPFLWAIRK